MKRICGVLIAALLLGGVVGCGREAKDDTQKKRSDPVTSLTYTLCSMERKSILRDTELLESLGRLTKSLRKALASVPEDQRKELEKILQSEEKKFAHFVEVHNRLVRWYNEMIQEYGFDREEGTKEMGKEPLEALDKWKATQ